MTKSWPLLALAVFGAVAAVFCLAAFDWTAWACRLPTGEEGKILTPSFGGCVEFWLNRYQTLIGAVVAIAAAAIAWIAVQQQVAVARKQLDLTLGYAEPEFVIAKSGWDTFTIHIFSQSRYPIVVESIELLMPDQAITATKYIHRPGIFHDYGHQVSEQLVHGSLKIPGSARPGSEIVEFEIEIATTMYSPGILPDCPVVKRTAEFQLTYYVVDRFKERAIKALPCEYEYEDTFHEG